MNRYTALEMDLMEIYSEHSNWGVLWYFNLKGYIVEMATWQKRFGERFHKSMV